MPSSSKRAFDQSKHPYPPITTTKQRENHRPSPGLALENLLARTRTSTLQKNDQGRIDRYAERANRIQPVKLSRSPSSAFRYPAPKSPPGTAYNANNVNLPLLPALGTTTNNRVGDWGKSIKGFANGRPTGTTPPSTAQQTQNRISPSHAHTSASPPANVAGSPLNHPNSHPNSSSFGERYQQSPPSNMAFGYGANRRASMASNANFGHGRGSMNGYAPPPHLDQPHFHGSPQIDFGRPARSSDDGNIKPGERGFFSGFDTLDGSADAASVGVENVLINGYEGGLDIYTVQHDGSQLIGVLEGLNGGVIGAKILPWTRRADPAAALRPLIAVVLHGPIINERETTETAAEADEQAIIDSPPMSPSVTRIEDAVSTITQYQTTVEVYSLATNSRVSTLFTSQPVEFVQDYQHDGFDVPPPADNITVEACGKFVVVALGRSGEVFVFTLAPEIGDEQSEIFRCIGKLWTSLQSHPPKALSNGISANATYRQDGDKALASSAPIFSLSHRWLAIVPPPSSAYFTGNGTPLANDSGISIPGMNVTHSPSPPIANCAVDTPDPRFLAEMGKTAAKNIVKGAQWVTGQAMQLIGQYTSKETPQNAINGYSHAAAQTAGFNHDPLYPPTKAAHNIPVNSNPQVIAMYDLNRLLHATSQRKPKYALQPIAVFEQLLGCTFLTFSPSGMHLFTACNRGDTQILWDLKRMCHGRGAARGRDSMMGPHVREIKRFGRISNTNVVDVAWSPPKDEKMAVLTAGGTLHVHRVPASAFQWPPLRKTARPSGPPVPPSDPVNNPQSTVRLPSPPGKSMFGSAVDSVNGAATWLSSIRGRNVSNGTAMSNLSITPIIGATAQGARAVTATTGRTIGEGVNYVRHHQDNKIHLLGAGAAEKGARVRPRCARWLTGDGRGLLATAANGTLLMHRVTAVVDTARGRGGRSVKRTVVSPYKRSSMHGLPGDVIAPAVMDVLMPKELCGGDAEGASRVGDREREYPGLWQPQSPWTPSGYDRMESKKKDRVMWKSFAELATTCDYQKFHTDPRVSLFVYADVASDSGSAIFGGDAGSGLQHEGHVPAAKESQRVHHVDDGEPWVFGLDVTHRKISSGAAAAASAGVVVAGEDAGGDVIYSSKMDFSGHGADDDDFDLIEFAEDRV